MNMIKTKIKILKIENNDDINLKNTSNQIDETKYQRVEEENFDDEIWVDFPFTKAN